eukprot:TRINITY_DN65038_c0_g2_i1.p2 TRINITY_DN65038_c0_g2~~TRINITY_DN65038_c0_g2_i1.p2  ORF type:complete len:278 (-),score=87.24 TRINITY_DN65038_c0_g2_i1:106-939(-)
MHRGSGYGKGSGKFGKAADRRDFATKDGFWADGSSDRGGGAERGDWRGGKGNPADMDASSNKASFVKIESQLQDLQKDFTSALKAVGEKENKKFDLIFSILTELQGKQADLEKSVRQLQTSLQTGSDPSVGAIAAAGASPAELGPGGCSGGGSSASTSAPSQPYMNGHGGQQMMMGGSMGGMSQFQGDNSQGMYMQQVMMMPSSGSMAYGGMNMQSMGQMGMPYYGGDPSSAYRAGADGTGDANASAGDFGGGAGMGEQAPWPQPGASSDAPAEVAS